jgi:prepilin-type processing-associated H-X9-DG protein
VGKVNTLEAFGPNWIISILPFLEEQSLHDSFDPSLYLPPDSAGFRPVNDNPAIVANQRARATEIPSLLCPSDPFNRILYRGGKSADANHGENWARTNYAASAGRGFIYPGTTAPSYMSGPDSPGWKDPCYRGVMGPNVAVTLKRVTDGTSKTIMLGEIRAGITPDDGRGVWAMGHAGPSLISGYGGGSDDNGPNATYSNADDVYTDLPDPKGLCITTGLNPIGSAEKMNAGGGAGFDQATIRSKHPGGAHVAMVDGSVNFISDDIETTGCYAPSASCCTAWDYMILSGDEGRLGIYNGASSGRGAGPACY